MRYLIALGAVGVLYVADQSRMTTEWSPLVTLAAALLVPVTIAMAIAGKRKGAGNGR